LIFYNFFFYNSQVLQNYLTWCVIVPAFVKNTVLTRTNKLK
jgi:hypothetical protein